MSNNPTGKGGFQERKHQINRKGRPKNFDALRELAQQIAHEITTVQTVDANGKVTGIDQRTRVEAIMRQWAQSKDARLQQAFIEYAYGKPPQQTQLTGKDGGPIETLDVTKLTNEQLERIAKGENVSSVLADKSNSGT